MNTHCHRSFSYLAPPGTVGVAASALSDLFETSPIVPDQLAREPQLDQVGLVDPLTGISNREGFCLAADRALRVVGHASGSLQVIFIAVDGSEEPTDQHGHGASDDALYATAHLLRLLSRAGEPIGRLGADGFAMFIPPPLGPPRPSLHASGQLRNTWRLSKCLPGWPSTPH